MEQIIAKIKQDAEALAKSARTALKDVDGMVKAGYSPSGMK